MRPVVVSIAGSDSSSGAGIQADLKSIEANGGWCATVVTAVTAQGPRGVRHVHRVPARSIEAQLAAVFDELPVAAVKTGMLAGPGTVRLVARVLRERGAPNLVCDPVLHASRGGVLLDEAGLRELRRSLLPLAAVVTPNVDEAARLSGVPVHDLESAERAARAILSQGPRAVLVTGGHLGPGERGTDLLVTAGGASALRAAALDTPELHGTGCVLAAALATLLARGSELSRAVEQAKRFVASSMRGAVALGGGFAVDPLFALHADGRGPEPA